MTHMAVVTGVLADGINHTLQHSQKPLICTFNTLHPLESLIKASVVYHSHHHWMPPAEWKGIFWHWHKLKASFTRHSCCYLFQQKWELMSACLLKDVSQWRKAAHLMESSWLQCRCVYCEMLLFQLKHIISVKMSLWWRLYKGQGGTGPLGLAQMAQRESYIKTFKE